MLMAMMVKGEDGKDDDENLKHLALKNTQTNDYQLRLCLRSLFLLRLELESRSK